MIGFFITARLKSTRLPGKVLLPLSGQPMLAAMIRRLRTQPFYDRMAICTSDLAADDPLAELAESVGEDCFRGDPADVLRRIRDASHAHDVDTIVSATADNPLVDPGWARRLVEYHLKNSADYGRISGLPFGTFCYTLSRSALDKACEIKEAEDTEVWGGYFTETGLFRTVTLEVDDPAVRRPDIRLTVDMPEDYELMTRIFAALDRPGKTFSLADVVRFLDDNPDIATLNRHITQQAPKPIRLKPEYRPQSS
jgi:spore coat polysaccharide biosynthesis protein SpsF